jgi:branched-subunit amino acid transport protein AzlD
MCFICFTGHKSKKAIQNVLLSSTVLIMLGVYLSSDKTFFLAVMAIRDLMGYKLFVVKLNER